METSVAGAPFSLAVALSSPFDAAPPAREEAASRVAAILAGGLARRFFVADLPPAAGAPAPEDLARLVLGAGGEPVVSVAAGAAAREHLLERVGRLHAAGVRDLLVVTGDHAAPGEEPGARPFHVDSVQLLMLLGRGDGGRRAGCVVSPNKSLEAELLWQYSRLRRKAEAGAGFVVAQAGYDPRAWDEVARFCRVEGIDRPLVGTVLVPDAELGARIRAGRVPGVAIPPGLLDRLCGGDPRPGLLLAGAAVAILRGLGYGGALLCGRRLGPEEVALVHGEAERIGPRWRERLGDLRPAAPRFAYFREDAATGLNTDARGPVRPRRRHHPAYVFSYLVDYVAFGSWEPFFRVLTAVCRFCDPRPFWRRALWGLEYVSKVPIYRCRMCGDCTLYACGFLCSESGCPKRLVNGPCGGSRDGSCEVDGAGTCLWVTIHDRLKAGSERPGFPAPPIPPKDRALQDTCSWINFCLGRDHRAARDGSGRPRLGKALERE